jgi:hypothetical protein
MKQCFMLQVCHEAYTLGWDGQSDMARIHRRSAWIPVFARETEQVPAIPACAREMERMRQSQCVRTTKQERASHLGGVGSPRVRA